MKQLVFFIFILTGTFSAEAQANFPNKWLGSYQGEMFIEDARGIQDTVWISFDLLATPDANRWTYRVSYNTKALNTSPDTNDKVIVKDYEIVWDEERGRFVLDEKDGILIDMPFMNNRFYSVYEVEGNVYSTLLEKTKSGLYLEIRCAKPKSGITSKSAPDQEGKSYTVKSSYTYMVQYANLKQKK